MCSLSREQEDPSTRLSVHLKIQFLSHISNIPPALIDLQVGLHFKFDESGRKFSKRVGNTLEKGKIAYYE